MIGIVFNDALNAAKTAANVGDHHVPDNKMSAGMRGIDFIAGFQWILLFGMALATIS
jgi:hypothetical protein